MIYQRSLCQVWLKLADWFWIRNFLKPSIYFDMLLSLLVTGSGLSFVQCEFFLPMDILVEIDASGSGKDFLNHR